MFSIAGRLALLLWPFFKEVFLKNDDVRYAVRRNWIGIVLFAILSLSLVLFLYTTDTFRETQEQYQTLETDLDRLVEVRNSLREELALVSEQFDSLEGRIREVMANNRELRNENEVLLEEVEGLVNQTCTPPHRRSNVRERLRELGGL